MSGASGTTIPMHQSQGKTIYLPASAQHILPLAACMEKHAPLAPLCLGDGNVIGWPISSALSSQVCRMKSGKPEERVAIMKFDSGMSRLEAEARAYKNCIIESFEQGESSENIPGCSGKNKR